MSIVNQNKAASDVSRRRFLGSVPAVTAMGLAAGCSKSPGDPWAFNLDGPDAIEVYAKMAGSLIEQELYLQYYGQVFSIEPGKMQERIFDLKGLVRMRWQPNGDGTYSYSNFDHGLFCDPETGRVLENWENPLTGETNQPLHYKSGPNAATVGFGDGKDDPSRKDWRVVGNQITVGRTAINEFENPVTAGEWGKASTGQMVRFTSAGTYFGRVDEVADRSLSAVDTDHNWTFVANYPAWMMMGNRPGHVLWRWIGAKFSDPTLIDPYIKSEILDRVPNYLTADEPWTQYHTGWSQYTRERDPMTGRPIGPGS